MKLQEIVRRYAIGVLNESGAFLGFVPDLRPVTLPNQALRFASVRGAEATIEAVLPNWARQGQHLIPWDMDAQAPADWSNALRDEETREAIPARACPCPRGDCSGYLESLAICLEASAARLRQIAGDLDRHSGGEGA